jgi:hypothetical protein
MSGTAASNKPIAKRGNPNWKPGKSGNPAGKPPGKHKITQLKQELEIAVRDHLQPGAIIAIIDKMVSQAKQGDVRAAKLIIDKVLSNAGETEDGTESGGSTFVFQVKNLTLKHDEPANPTIDAEFSVIPSPSTGE